jgi:hypothetical protein
VNAIIATVAARLKPTSDLLQIHLHSIMFKVKSAILSNLLEHIPQVLTGRRFRLSFRSNLKKQNVQTLILFHTTPKISPPIIFSYNFSLHKNT